MRSARTGRRPKVTWEENEQEIEQLESKIARASQRRDYVKADQFQTQLDYCHEIRKQLAAQKIADNRQEELNRLAQEQKNEEERLRDQMDQEMQELIDTASVRFQQMEQRRQEKLDKLDVKFSDPRFTALRMSSNVKSLLRAEDYYVKQRNYKVANRIKQQVTSRTEFEVALQDETTNKTVDAAVEAVERRFDQEKRGFHAKLEEDTTNLNRKAGIQLLTIHNKYVKLRSRVLANGEPDKPNPDEGKAVRETIESKYNDFVTSIDYNPTVPTTPRASRGSSRRSNAMATTNRNPRITRALERSILRRSLASTL